MKKIKIVLVLFLCLIQINVIAQSKVKCWLCKMDINDNLFRSQATVNGNEVVQFDAIECLVNYLKKEENKVKNLKVADYQTGELIDAKNAFYLKSQAIQSPMGGNLSAFAGKENAEVFQKEKGGDIFSWEDLKECFASLGFGGTDHSHHNHNRPDAYAPSGVMGDHLHPKGGLMISLKYMNMIMDGNRRGNNKIEGEDIYQEFMIAPQAMTMQMYMLGVMYAPLDKLTLMIMQNFVKKDMDLTARMMMGNGMPMFTNFSTSSKGIGDLKLNALYGLWSGDKASFHLNAGINFPIGDIENRDNTPMMQDAKLPYAMQLGSGTFDMMIGGTYKGNSEQFSWGLQQLNTFRTGTNSEEYRFGNLHQLNIWGAYFIANAISTSIRVNTSTEGDISGRDNELNPRMVTTADPKNYGGELIRSFAGVNLLLANNKLILGAEVGIPIYQNYNGIFMNEELTINTSLKYTVL